MYPILGRQTATGILRVEIHLRVSSSLDCLAALIFPSCLAALSFPGCLTTLSFPLPVETLEREKLSMALELCSSWSVHSSYALLL